MRGRVGWRGARLAKLYGDAKVCHGNASVAPAGGRIVKKNGIDEANLTKRGKGFKRMFCSDGTFAHVGNANVAVYTRGAAGCTSLIKALTDLPPGWMSSNMDLAHGKFKSFLDSK